METCHPSEIELGLERIKTVAGRLGLLSRKPLAKIIIVAGTNGKGTFVTTLEALLLKAGCRVGTYTSPHIVHYNERIRINGVESADAVLCETFEKIDHARAEISLTYFEFGTLAAFLLLAEAELDYWILEVGMGGRLDAVNILDPDIAVITSISMDHENWLGSTRELIGAEKAGIIRKNGLVICCDEDPPSVIGQKIRELQAMVYFIHQQYGYQIINGELNFFVSDNSGRQYEFNGLPETKLPLPSVSAAIQAFRLLGQEFTRSMLGACLAQLKVPGRFQRVPVNGRHDILLDVAHNPAAMKYLAGNLELLRKQGVEKIEVVVAMMRDKNMAESLGYLVPLVDNWYPVGFARYSRAVDTKVLSDILLELGVSGEKIQCFSSTSEALANCLAAKENELAAKRVTLVTGSFYPVGEASSFVREWQQQCCVEEGEAWTTD